MKKINLYYHTGSANHGCEAIVRGMQKILGNNLRLFSFKPEDELKYKLDGIIDLQADIETPIQKKSLKYFLAALQFKIAGTTTVGTYFRKRNFFSKVSKGDLCLSIGGDNYTYAGILELADYNKILHHRGAKTVLFGCSIDAELIPKLKDDLSRYDMIVARETLTFEALQKNQIRSKIRLCPDPAFQLRKNEVVLPALFLKHKTVGINLSPLILKYGNSDLIMKNFENLIHYIFSKTDLQIALIPHVFVPENNDWEVMLPFYEKFKNTKRVLILDDCSCQDLKGYISQCRFFLGARTHATIAAYSTEVPTIAIGYSMKAKGIAKDIFGTYENYVCPVQNFTTENELINSFKWLVEHEMDIKELYENTMLDYKSSALNAAGFLKELE